MAPEEVTHAPLCLAITLLLSAARVMTLGRKIGESGQLRRTGIAPPCQEGWTRHQEKYREASFDGADGVVVQDQQIFLILNHHPVSGHKVANATFS